MYLIVISAPEKGNEHEPTPGKVELWRVLDCCGIVQQYIISVVVEGRAARAVSPK